MTLMDGSFLFVCLIAFLQINDVLHANNNESDIELKSYFSVLRYE